MSPGCDGGERGSTDGGGGEGEGGGGEGGGMGGGGEGEGGGGEGGGLGGGGEGEGGGGDGGGDTRGPQSLQSIPYGHKSDSAPAPPSWQLPSPEALYVLMKHVSRHIIG